MKVRLGTRGSDLARSQSGWVASALAAGGIECELVIIATDGDLKQDERFAEIGAAGVFVRSIEAALLDDAVDLAVHSFKDLPSRSPEELTIAAVPAREDPGDVLFVREDAWVDPEPSHGLPLRQGARVGTAAARRRALLADMRPDLEVCHLRGNVPTRIRKLQDGAADAIVLAAAGVHRLAHAGVQIDMAGVRRHPLDPRQFVPAPAQGLLAIQTRHRDEELTAAIRAVLDDADARRALAAERDLLARLDGGCDIALGAWCSAAARPPAAPVPPPATAELVLLAAWEIDGRLLRSRMLHQDPAVLAERAYEDLQRQAQDVAGKADG